MAPFAMGASASVDLARAQKACDQGEYREAIHQFNRLLTDRVGTDTAAEPDEALDRCLRAVEGSEQAGDLLRDFTDTGLAGGAYEAAYAVESACHAAACSRGCRTA
jgi:hypothetical protein